MYFDGICNLCHRSVAFVARHDKKGIFYFASLQSDFAHRHLADFIDMSRADTVVYEKNGVIFTLSDAVLELLHDMGGIWKMFYAFKMLPKPWRDGLYRYIAAHRYGWFGRRDHCAWPGETPEIRILK